MTKSLVSDELIAVYKQSNYLIFAKPDFRLNIGQTSPRLLALYQKHKVDSAVFISAYNPCSERQSDGENARQNLMLETDIQALNYPFYLAEGQDPENIWPSEKSFLVLGMPLSIGSELASQYGQNAILYCQHKGFVELVLLR